MKKRVRRLLRSRRGTTLVELLAATAVMILFSLMVNSGLQLALQSYHKMRAEAETQLLLSTVSDVIADELRYARNIKSGADGTLRTYTSDSYGVQTSIQLDSNGQLQVDAGGTVKRLLATGAYGTDGAYQITELSVKWEQPNFAVEIKVADESGIEAAAELSVRCLNERATEEE